MARYLYRLGQLIENLGGDRLGEFRFVQIRQNNKEFVTAFARNGVALADGFVQSFSDIAQHVVTGVVSECVVDQLEAIKVDEQQGNVLLLSTRLQNGLVQPVLHQSPVG